MRSAVVPLAPVQHAFLASQDGQYALHVPEYGLSFHVDRLRRERHQLIGELTVRANLAGASTVRGILSYGDFNFSSTTTRATLAKHLALKSRAPDLDWPNFLEELCLSVVDGERSSQPLLWLPEVAPPEADADILRFAGLALPRRHPGIWFGDGGTLKSLLALWVAGHLTRAGLKVLLADWELTETEHRDRLGRLFGAGGAELPRVAYVRCDRPLVVESDGLRRRIRDEGIDYVVLDSIAVGCAGPPESAEVAADYMRALRQIGVGTLCLAHVSKAEDGDKKPFGSAFWHNLARATWHLKRSEPVMGDTSSVDVCLTQRKNNLGPMTLPFAYRVTFDAQQTSVARVDAASIEEFAPALPLWQRLRVTLRRGGAQTVADLARQLETTVDTVNRTIKRDNGRAFLRLDGPDGVSRVALKDVASRVS